VDIEVAARQGAGDRSRARVQHFSLRKQRLDLRSFSLKRLPDPTAERVSRLEVEVLATDPRTLSEVSHLTVRPRAANGALPALRTRCVVRTGQAALQASFPHTHPADSWYRPMYLGGPVQSVSSNGGTMTTPSQRVV